MRESLVSLYTGGWEESDAPTFGSPVIRRLTNSSWTLESFFTYMDLNFRNVKTRPYWPCLFWRNVTGPSDVSLIAMAMATSTGVHAIKASKLPTISMHRLANRETLRPSANNSPLGSRLEQSGFDSFQSSGNT